MKKRIAAAVLFLALLLTCVPFASSSANIFFVAYNDTVPLTLSGDDGLLSYKDVLLAPHTVFSVNGVGLTTAYDAEEKTMTIYSRSKRLKFDLEEGLVTDENGMVSSTMCAYRNLVIFLPVELCAKHFDLAYSLVRSRDGYVVLRFTNGSQIYDDDEFIQKAENLIAYRVKHYLEEQGGKEPEIIPPIDDPGVPDDPPEIPSDPDATPPTVYLAITGASSMERSLTLLRQARIPAVFYFTAEEILQQPALVRAVRASDFPIGITVAPGEMSVAEKLRAANEALDEVTQSKTLLALLTAEQQAQAPGYFSVDPNAAVLLADVGKAEVPCLMVCRDDLEQILAELHPHAPVYRRIRETTHF